LGREAKAAKRPGPRAGVRKGKKTGGDYSGVRTGNLRIVVGPTLPRPTITLWNYPLEGGGYGGRSNNKPDLKRNFLRVFRRRFNSG